MAELQDIINEVCHKIDPLVIKMIDEGLDEYGEGQLNAYEDVLAYLTRLKNV